MSTELARELRKLRIDEGITLMEMAKKLGISSAFLSAVENGKKRIPDRFLEQLATAYPAVSMNKKRFEVLINSARQEVRMELKGASIKDVELATALARSFGELTLKQKQQLLETLKGKANA